MPKKNSSWGVNTKAVEAREKKAEKKRNEHEAKQKAIEDAYWKDDNKQEQKKKDRKEAEQRKKQETLARKQEAKKLLEEEEAKLGSKTAKAAPVKKVTRADIDKKKEKDQKQLEELVILREKEKKKITDNPVMEEENPNRIMAEALAAEGGIEARNVEDAISVLSIGKSSEIDLHPEKRMKAAYNEFEQREMARVKAENPNLRLSQLKQILRKEWQKSPDNPFNQR